MLQMTIIKKKCDYLRVEAPFTGLGVTQPDVLEHISDSWQVHGEARI
jgi:hypothetical protein